MTCFQAVVTSFRKSAISTCSFIFHSFSYMNPASTRSPCKPKQKNVHDLRPSYSRTILNTISLPVAHRYARIEGDIFSAQKMLFKYLVFLVALRWLLIPHGNIFNFRVAAMRSVREPVAVALFYVCLLTIRPYKRTRCVRRSLRQLV